MRKPRVLLVVVATLVAALLFVTRCDETVIERAATGARTTEESQTARPTAERVPRSRSADADVPTDTAPAAPATTGTIGGIVLGPDGRPAAGARVLLHPEGKDEERTFSPSGADGAFRSEALAPGRYIVVVCGGGFATRLDVRGTEPSVADVVAGGEARVELHATRLAVLAGRVLGPGDVPVADAAIKIQCTAFLYANQTAWHLEAKTGADGTFERANVTPGDYLRVEVRAEGCPVATSEVRAVEPGQRVEVVVRLERGAELVVEVVDAADGSPVKGALVWFCDANGGGLFADNAVSSDERGRASATVPASRRVQLQISAKEYVAIPHRYVDRPGALQGPHVVRLERAKSISGRARRPDGSGAAGLKISAFPPDGGADISLDSFRAQAETDADGRFRIEGLAAGRWSVGVVADGEFRPAATTECEAGAQDVVVPVGKDVRAVEHVVVRVVASDGTPVAKFRFLEGAHADQGIVFLAGGLQHEGTAEFDVDRRAIAFVEIWAARDATGRRLPLGHVHVDVPDGVPHEWTITLPPEQTIEGRVIGPDGKAAAGATIAIGGVAPFDPHATDPRQIGEVTADADGVFHAGSLGAGEYLLTATSAGAVPSTLRVRGGAKSVEFRLAREAPAVVHVLDPDGKPALGVRVCVIFRTVETGMSIVADVRTDATGSATLRGLEGAKTYELEVGFDRGHGAVRKTTIERWTPIDTDVRLERAFSIEGVVHVASGAESAEWKGTVEATRDGIWLSSTSLSPDGRFEIDGLPAGRVTLTANVNGPQRLTGRIDAEAGGAAVTIELASK